MKWLIVTLTLAGCGLAQPSRGTVVAPGVAEALFEHRAFGTDLVRTRVVFAADEQGMPTGRALPAVVFIQGGLVPELRYRWWAEALARAGYVVALPQHQLELAFFSADTGLAARQLLAEAHDGLLAGLVDVERFAVAGHSLGGVVAAQLFEQRDFRALLLEASYPAEGSGVAAVGPDRPRLSLAGSADCSARLDTVTAGAERLGSPSALVVLEGVTHYQFTDAQSEELERGCASGVDLETAHQRIVATSLAFLDGALAHPPRVDAPRLRAVAGSQVTVR